MPQRPDVRRRDEKRPLHGSAVELEHFMCILDRQLKWPFSRALQADARTRTGDPFIRRDEPMSAPVRSSHLRPFSMRDSMDWSGLEVTGEDNLVDGWWTPEMLSLQRTTPQANDQSGLVGRPRRARGVPPSMAAFGQCPPQAYISSRGWLSCCASPNAVFAARLVCIQ